MCESCQSNTGVTFQMDWNVGIPLAPMPTSGIGLNGPAAGGIGGIRLVALDALGDDDDEKQHEVRPQQEGLRMDLLGPQGPADARVDASLYDYDGCYDEIKRQEAASMPSGFEAAEPEAPKFIPKLLERARERQEEIERLQIEALERQLKEERSNRPGEQEYLTEGYQQHLRHLQVASQSSDTATCVPDLPHTAHSQQPPQHRSQQQLARLTTTSERAAVWPVVDAEFAEEARLRYLQRQAKREQQARKRERS